MELLQHFLSVLSSACAFNPYLAEYVEYVNKTSHICILEVQGYWEENIDLSRRQ